jgi:hypothetical protein
MEAQRPIADHNKKERSMNRWEFIASEPLLVVTYTESKYK